MKHKIFFFLLLMGLASVATAQGEVKGILHQLQETYSQVQGFQGQFKQEHYTKKGEAPRHATGVISYKHPDQMRWEYDPPNAQTLVINSETMWLYDPLLENVTIRDVKKSEGGNALLELMDFGNLTQNFTQRLLTRKILKDTENRVIELIPKHTRIGDLKFAQIEVSEDRHVSRLVLFNQRGSYQIFELIHIDYAPSFDENFFEFQVSENMEVIYLNE